jgi:arginase
LTYEKACISRGSADNAPPSVTGLHRRIELIGAACGRGGPDPGCAQGPARLAAGGLADLLKARGANIAWGAMVQTRGGSASQAVSGLVARLAAEVAHSLRSGRLPCVIGGDHSIAVGTWSGVSAAISAAPGLIWIDAHLDSHTPRSSPSGRLHGMPLAALLGEGDDELAGLGARIVDPRHLCLLGARSYEVEETRLLERLGVRVITHAELQRRGICVAIEEALSIARAAPAGFGISLDLDVLDPEIAPGVATPVPTGLRATEIGAALFGIASDPGLLALEIAEYCPRRDRDGRTERAVEVLLGALLGLDEAREDSQVLTDAVEAL